MNRPWASRRTFVLADLSLACSDDVLEVSPLTNIVACRRLSLVATSERASLNHSCIEIDKAFAFYS